ncbi:MULTISPECIES: TetR/AcrR family transcriptional regulator [Kocuria]|uniref:TetR family transcriptional regulator n=1 Tax=Kocuria rosea subsp. polaris TaxID=136273 RepID=A0A0A6VS05_KOCRO|nr:TetR family transcriptional regulator [Kocuria polaris]KHD96559.1 TetR family transcriptional regulator [Kocuria polaris]
MRARRTDPDRRDRLVGVTLELIAEAGVSGVSHRKIAAAADVPLGSMTYHFTGMDELLHEAFTRFAEHIAGSFQARLSAAENPQEAVEAVVDLVHELSEPGSHRDRVLAYELYTLAAREPRYRAITSSWMRRSRQELQRHFDPRTTRQLDALIEGLALHRALDEDPFDRSLTEDAVRRIVTPALGPAPADENTAPTRR